MTERDLEKLGDGIYGAMDELIECACILEDIGHEKEGLAVRDVAGDLENIWYAIKDIK